MISTTFKIGNDLQVNRIGYGAMRLTGQPGNFGAYHNWEGGKQLLQHAVELGINFIDKAEAYGPGYNEEIIAASSIMLTNDEIERILASNILVSN